jgi:hypothetical protein
MSIIEASPDQLKAAHIHQAFEWAMDPKPVSHSAGIFEVLSLVPGFRILDDGSLKDRVDKTLIVKGDTLTVRLDPEIQNMYQMSAEIQHMDPVHSIVFRFKKNDPTSDTPVISYSLMYDAETGEKIKVIIDQPGISKRLGVHIESDNECAGLSMGGHPIRPIKPLTEEQLERFMSMMMGGIEPYLPNVFYLVG